MPSHKENKKYLRENTVTDSSSTPSKRTRLDQTFSTSSRTCDSESYGDTNQSYSTPLRTCTTNVEDISINTPGSSSWTRGMSQQFSPAEDKFPGHCESSFVDSPHGRHRATWSLNSTEVRALPSLSHIHNSLVCSSLCDTAEYANFIVLEHTLKLTLSTLLDCFVDGWDNSRL